MGVSLYDQFTTTDWDFISSRGSQFSAGIALLLAVISCFLGRQDIMYNFFFTCLLGLKLSSQKMCSVVVAPFSSKLADYRHLRVFIIYWTHFVGFISWVAIYTLIVGLVLCVWELPVIYSCVPAGGPCFCYETQTAALVWLSQSLKSLSLTIYTPFK